MEGRRGLPRAQQEWHCFIFSESFCQLAEFPIPEQLPNNNDVFFRAKNIKHDSCVVPNIFACVGQWEPHVIHHFHSGACAFYLMDRRY